MFKNDRGTGRTISLQKGKDEKGIVQRRKNFEDKHYEYVTRGDQMADSKVV